MSSPNSHPSPFPNPPPGHHHHPLKSRPSTLSLTSQRKNSKKEKGHGGRDRQRERGRVFSNPSSVVTTTTSTTTRTNLGGGGGGIGGGGGRPPLPGLPPPPAKRRVPSGSGKSTVGSDGGGGRKGSAVSLQAASGSTGGGGGRYFGWGSSSNTNTNLASSSSSLAGGFSGTTGGSGTGIQGLSGGGGSGLGGLGGGGNVLRPKDLDLMEVRDPDEVFRVFGVRDVVEVERRAKASADAKRDELRTMVGERYRDLLSAAESIIRMRKSSSAFLLKLELARAACNGPRLLGRRPLSSPHELPPPPFTPGLPSSTTTQSPNLAAYTLATLLSLLVSTPESVYRALEAEEFLAAARLEGLGKVVYRELVGNSTTATTSNRRRKRRGMDDSDGEEDSEEEVEEEGEESKSILDAVPLIERQWERLAGLGAVVARRGRASLVRIGGDSHSTADTLASIVLLESISLPEALKLLLSQRSKALSAVLTQPLVQSSTKRDDDDDPQDIAPPSRAERGDVAFVSKKLEEAIEIVLRTLDHAFDAFVGNDGEKEEKEVAEDGGDGGGILLDLLESIQRPEDDDGNYEEDEEDVFNVQRTTKTKKKNGDQKSSPAKGASRFSLPRLLQSLPSSNLLLRYLPPHILSYTPFIDTKSNRNRFSPPTNKSAKGIIEDWFESSCETLSRGFGEMIKRLKSGMELKKVADKVESSLNISINNNNNNNNHVDNHFGGEEEEEDNKRIKKFQEFRKTLFDVVQEKLWERLNGIYRDKLEGLVISTSKQLLSALENLPKSKEDLDPPSFVFSPNMQFPPSTFTFVPTPGRDPFDTFRFAIQRRTNGRSPLMDKALRRLESLAQDIREDTEEWLLDVDGRRRGGGGRSDKLPFLQRKFNEAIQVTFQGIVGSFDDTLAKVQGGELAERVEVSLFLGSFALSLRASETFIPDLTYTPGCAGLARRFRQALVDYQTRTLTTWQRHSVEAALLPLQQGFDKLSQKSLLVPEMPSWESSPNSSNEATSQLRLPSQPSTSVLSSLLTLVSQVRRVGEHRIQAEPTVVPTLMKSFEGQVLEICERLQASWDRLELDDGGIGKDVALQILWDLRLLDAFWVAAGQVLQGARSKADELRWHSLKTALAVHADVSLETLESIFPSTVSTYLRRTQVMFLPLLPAPNHLTLGQPSSSSSSSNTLLPDRTSSFPLLLPFGAPPTSSTDFKTAVELVKPGPRLGLLPVR